MNSGDAGSSEDSLQRPAVWIFIGAVVLAATLFKRRLELILIVAGIGGAHWVMSNRGEVVDTVVSALPEIAFVIGACIAIALAFALVGYTVLNVAWAQKATEKLLGEPLEAADEL